MQLYAASLAEAACENDRMLTDDVSHAAGIYRARARQNKSVCVYPVVDSGAVLVDG